MINTTAYRCRYLLQTPVWTGVDLLLLFNSEHIWDLLLRMRSVCTHTRCQHAACRYRLGRTLNTYRSPLPRQFRRVVDVSTCGNACHTPHAGAVRWLVPDVLGPYHLPPHLPTPPTRFIGQLAFCDVVTFVLYRVCGTRYPTRFTVVRCTTCRYRCFRGTARLSLPTTAPPPPLFTHKTTFLY